MILILAIFATGPVIAQQEFFLDTWKPKIIQIPEHTETLKPSQPANVSLTVNAYDTITRIPLYMFGDNANTYTGSMSENKKLMAYLADRNMGVLRGPSGGNSDVYFWNRSEYQRPADVPNILVGRSDSNGPKYIISYSSRFISGQLSTILINKGPGRYTARINARNATVGDHFYTYTLTGGDDIRADPARLFSRKVLINGTGPSAVAGGPPVYDTIRTKSFETGDEILVETPPYSVTYVLIDTGNIQLEINNKFSPNITWNNPADITYGTVLTSKQLNASANIPGDFIYTPPQASTASINNNIK